MAEIADLNTFSSFFKELYSDWKIPYSSLKKSPLLMTLTHNKKGAFGADQAVPIEIGPGSGRSADFATAQSTAGGSNSVKFQVRWVSDYAVVEMQNDAIDYSQGGGAVEDMVTREVETKARRLMTSLGQALYGDGSGRCAQSSTGDATGLSSISLTNRFDAIHLKTGDAIQVVAPGANAVRSGTALITKVDRINGILYFGAAVTSAIGAYTPGDYIVMQGDFNSKIMGLSGWLPGKSLTSAPFFGVDRTQDPTECAGFYQDYSNSAISLEEAIIEAATEVCSNDGMPDNFFLHPMDWRKLQGSLSSLSRVDQLEVEKDGMSYGFPSIHLIAGNANLSVLADPFCPQSQGFLITNDSWELRTHGEIGKFVTQRDGSMLRPRDTSDVSEARMCYRGNLVCKTPRYNSRVYLPTPVGR